MASQKSTALVPVPNGRTDLAKRVEKPDDALRLVKDDVNLIDREEVKKYLPDILGRALARIWIDTKFAHSFELDPKQTLANAGVHVPENMTIEYDKPRSDRPKIIVYERPSGSRFKVRVLYLQLVMLAGK